jgi:hypothetical protein
MTLYRATKQEFLEDIDNGKDVTGFVSLMKDFYLSESGKEAGVKEIKSWYTSLPAMARVLQLSHIPADTQVYIEYEIPRAVSKRHIDFMLAGKDSEGDDAVVVVELKAWQWKYAGWKKPRGTTEAIAQAAPQDAGAATAAVTATGQPECKTSAVTCPLFAAAGSGPAPASKTGAGRTSAPPDSQIQGEDGRAAGRGQRQHRTWLYPSTLCVPVQIFPLDQGGSQRCSGGTAKICRHAGRRILL